MTDTDMLRTKIDESGYKLTFIAKCLEISYQALLNKINNVTEFKQSEIVKLCNLLGLSESERDAIFLAAE